MIGPVLAAALAAATVLLFAVALGIEHRQRFLDRIIRRDDVAPPSGDAKQPSSRTVPFLAAVGGGFLGAFVAGPVVGIAVAVGGVLAPMTIDRRRKATRRATLEEQLLDAVTAIASALRSGRSLGQALVSAAGEAGAPLSGILAEAAQSVSLGIPLDGVLDGFADAVGSSDARLVAGVLKVHRRTGAAIAAALDDVASTLAARREAARELRSLTAQARLSAAILGLLPLGFFLFMSLVARRDIESAYRTTAGASAIGVGFALQGAAFVWIRSLLRVEER